MNPVIYTDKTLPEDAFFIKRKKDGAYLHYGGEADKDNVFYFFSKTKMGACGWTKQKGEGLISMYKLDGVELVNVRDDNK